MNQEEFQSLSDLSTDERVITGDDLTGPSRVLIYGYTVDRDTFVTRYDENSNTITVTIRPGKYDEASYSPTMNEGFVPNKRCYPDRCDYEFCKLLIERGVYVSFLGNYEWPATPWKES